MLSETTREDGASEPITFLAELLSSETTQQVLDALRRFIHGILPDAYATLWYLDDTVTPGWLLLADEFGNRFGGSVTPLHNRLRIGTGIVGAAVKNEATTYHDMTQKEDRRVAANISTVDIEQIRSITTIPLKRSYNSPAGAILLGLRESRFLPPDIENLIAFASTQAIRSLTRVVAKRSQSILPILVSTLSELDPDDAILQKATEVLVREFNADYGVALLSDASQSHTVMLEYPAANDPAMNPVHRGQTLNEISFRGLPPSVRLFHATDPEELDRYGVSTPVAERMRKLLTGRVDHLSHVIGAVLKSPGSYENNNGMGILLLTRRPTALSFLPEEEVSLVQIAQHLSFLISLQRSEQTRHEVVSTSVNVAERSDLDLALVSFFLNVAELTNYSVASVLLETEQGSWNSYSVTSENRANRGPADMEARHVTISDPAMKALDRVRIKLAESDENRADTEWIRASLIPPPDHRTLGRNRTTHCYPLILRGELRGAAFLTESTRYRYAPQTDTYIEFLGQQLILNANLHRLRKTEARFLTLVDAFDRLLSGSILSLGLGHETKGKLNTFALGFRNLRTIAGRIEGSRAGAELRDEVSALKRIAAVGSETVATLNELAHAMSSALLQDQDGDEGGGFSDEVVYLNEVLRLYHRGLRLVGKGEDRDKKKEINMTLAPELDRPKEGKGTPVSTDPIDRVRLGQLFSNLVLNALDASPARTKVDVITTLEKSEDSLKRTATLTVRDYGIGMSDEVKGRIFEPFFSRKPSGVKPGFGLGMLIVRLIVDQIGGELSFESRPYAGTTFTVHLPIPLKSRHGSRI